MTPRSAPDAAHWHKIRLPIRAVHLLRAREPLLVLVAIWTVGLLSLAAILMFEQRLDNRRHAQAVLADVRSQTYLLSKLAFDSDQGYALAQVLARLHAREGQIERQTRTLTALTGQPRDTAPLAREARRVFTALDAVSRLAAAHEFAAANSAMIRLEKGPEGALTRMLANLSGKYDRQAQSARSEAEIGIAATIVCLLAAFSFALGRTAVLARRLRRQALTDPLTGLANRRRLFADLQDLLQEARTEAVMVGIFDLDGFKAYNDTFGHPAGDALLARLARRLAGAAGREAVPYRMGGDEFCVIARGADAAASLARAHEALIERGVGYYVGCSVGSASVAPNETSLEAVLGAADRQLYDAKPGVRRTRESPVEPAQPAPAAIPAALIAGGGPPPRGAFDR